MVEPYARHRLPPADVVARRHGWYTLALLVAAVSAIGGFTALMLAVEPDSTYISGRPWLVVLNPSRIGVQFITYGGDYTTLLYGIVDGNGNWISWPVPIVPRFDIHVFPWDAVTIADAAGRIHIAWTLFDSDRGVQTFHYVQLDSEGRVRAQAGFLGGALVDLDASAAPVPPGLLVTDQEVRVYWQHWAIFMETRLDLSGRVTSGPAEVPSVDSAAYPPRTDFEGRTGNDAWASAGTDGAGNTFLVWQHQGFRGIGPNLFREFDLQFRKTGSRDMVERTLYSTVSSWWMTKAIVIPAFIAFVVGAVAVPIFANRRRTWADLRTGAKPRRRLWFLSGR